MLSDGAACYISVVCALAFPPLCFAPAGCVGLDSFSRSRVGPRLDVRPTSRQKVTLIIGAAVCGASPFISTRRRETLKAIKRQTPAPP